MYSEFSSVYFCAVIPSPHPTMQIFGTNYVCMYQEKVSDQIYPGLTMIINHQSWTVGPTCFSVADETHSLVLNLDGEAHSDWIKKHLPPWTCTWWFTCSQTKQKPLPEILWKRIRLFSTLIYHLWCFGLSFSNKEMCMFPCGLQWFFFGWVNINEERIPDNKIICKVTFLSVSTAYQSSIVINVVINC